MHHPHGWVVSRGEKILTLKARGVLVEGSLEELREELYLTRRAIQYIVDALWELEKLPSINHVHQMFYIRYFVNKDSVHTSLSRYTSTLEQ